MSCPECFSGHVNPGKPTGNIETIYGLKTYVARPPNNRSPLGVIVIISDAFGMPFVNNQILADHYASAGQYLVYLPDFMDGAEVPLSMMYNMAKLSENSWLWAPYYIPLVAWDLIPHLIRNRVSVCWPRMTSFLTALRSESSLPIAAAGFCWGGLHAIMLTHDRSDTKTAAGAEGKPLVDVAFAAHPSALSMPGDIEKVKLPLSIAIGDQDSVMGMSQVRQAQDILKGKEAEVTVYPGARHGFSVRASRSVPDSMETRQADEAEKQALDWFKKHFAKVQR